MSVIVVFLRPLGLRLTDYLSPGVDFAHVAYRTALTARANTSGTSGTGQLVGVIVPAAAGATGTVICDLTVAFN